jgi:hypothetical protein
VDVERAALVVCVAHVVKTQGAVRVYVTTTASGDHWQASVTSAQGRALPKVRFGYKDLGTAPGRCRSTPTSLSCRA